MNRREALALPVVAAVGMAAGSAGAEPEPVIVGWFNGIPISLGGGIYSIQTQLDHSLTRDINGKVVMVESKNFRLTLEGAGVGVFVAECKRLAHHWPVKGNAFVRFESSDRRIVTEYNLQMFNHQSPGRLVIELQRRA